MDVSSAKDKGLEKEESQITQNEQISLKMIQGGESLILNSLDLMEKYKFLNEKILEFVKRDKDFKQKELLLQNQLAV